ncbi:hypothetical protein RSSM_04811 [Rhodopirellula sallentina SM41]|uniref:Uncharacterized protein n=1 Tax=Rhodopirellula sallentina SM41 TaxID=1263870 RepID=M5UCN2_9BACT|nr:hypothetical protein RSSM_04811 [Rhodopirellula sallentina SM41]
MFEARRASIVGEKLRNASIRTPHARTPGSRVRGIALGTVRIRSSEKKRAKEHVSCVHLMLN